MLDLLPVGIIVTDRDASATYANKTWTEMTGQNPSWHGLGWFDVLEDADRDRERESLLAAIGAGGQYSSDWTVAAPEGEARVLHISAVPQRTAGQVAGIVVSVDDVTIDRARTERLLDEATHDPLTGLVNRTSSCRSSPIHRSPMGMPWTFSQRRPTNCAHR